MPRRDSRFHEALPNADSSSTTDASSTPSSPATSLTPLLAHHKTSASKTTSTRKSGTASLKRKVHDIVFGKPAPLSSEGWVLRPDLLFEMQKAVGGRSREDVRRELAKAEEDAAGTANGKEGRRGKKRPTSAAEVEALMLRYIVEG